MLPTSTGRQHTGMHPVSQPKALSPRRHGGDEPTIIKFKRGGSHAQTCYPLDGG